MEVEKYIVAFRRLPSEGIHNCELQKMPQEKTYMLKEQIFPGMFGKPPMYIRHHKAQYGNKQILIIFYTEQEINFKIKQDLVNSLLELLVREKLISEEDLK